MNSIQFKNFMLKFIYNIYILKNILIIETIINIVKFFQGLDCQTIHLKFLAVTMTLNWVFHRLTIGLVSSHLIKMKLMMFLLRMLLSLQSLRIQVVGLLQRVQTFSSKVSLCKLYLLFSYKFVNLFISLFDLKNSSVSY